MKHHPISTTSREATLYIHDLRGPHQSTQMTKNAPKLNAFLSSTFDKWLKSWCSITKFLPKHKWLLFYISSTPREATLHFCDHRDSHPSLKMTKKTCGLDAFSSSNFKKWLKSCCGAPKFSSRPTLPLHSISSTSMECNSLTPGAPSMPQNDQWK